MKKEPQIPRLEDNNNAKQQELQAYEAAYSCAHPKTHYLQLKY